MCGIAGILNLQGQRAPKRLDLEQMIAILKHRGADAFGIYRDNQIGMGCARLSIIDIEGGHQPISNENGSVWVVLNGEIFNYIELRALLTSKGHVFKSQSDTEVLVHLYEEFGTAMLNKINGQFALAIWDKFARKLFLARDRMGIHPLFYTISNGMFFFASEIKSLFSNIHIQRKIDIFGLDQVLTFWTCIGQRTLFEGVKSILPGQYLVVENSNIEAKTFWEFPVLTVDTRRPGTITESEIQNHAQILFDILKDSISLRLRSDVPVGAYLSGGLDSSTISYIASTLLSGTLKTFSISFEDSACSESEFQSLMASRLGSQHYDLHCKYDDIGEVFPEVIWHSETALIRTAPIPLYLLSRLVREQGVKVILTGEGADEILLGYDIYKAAKAIQWFDEKKISLETTDLLRYLLDRDPFYNSKTEKEAFEKPDVYFNKYYNVSSKSTFGVHQNRWDHMSDSKRFYTNDIREETIRNNPFEEFLLLLPKDFLNRSYLQRAQYLDTQTLLPGYLLSTQGDRMSLAHSVEERFPFLDHNLIEAMTSVDSELKLNNLNEKYLLKRAMENYLPKEICSREKHAFTAPILKGFFNKKHEYIDELMSDENIRKTSFFDAKKVNELMYQCRIENSGGLQYYSDLVPILSIQLLDYLFVKQAPSRVDINKLEFIYFDEIDS